ncbi:hypothetical protein Bca4012_018499 [Brassica carinata]
MRREPLSFSKLVETRGLLRLLRGSWNTTSAESNIRHLVYLLEIAIINLPKGQEQMSLLIDFTGWSMANNAPMKTKRDIIYILQNHYPERLGMSFLYNPPRLFQAGYKAVKYFFPKNSSKGEATLEYDHEEFSRQMFEDDLKTAKFWGLEEKQYSQPNDFSPADVVPEPATSLASVAS